jgi:hypothetical protein
VQAAVQAAEEAEVRLRATLDARTGQWSSSYGAAHAAMTAANLARDVAARGYYNRAMTALMRIVGASTAESRSDGNFLFYLNAESFYPASVHRVCGSRPIREIRLGSPGFGTTHVDRALAIGDLNENVVGEIDAMKNCFE